MAAVIMIAGLAAGPQTGFLVGSVAALASNFIFGQGPWTPWQMLAFGVAGLVAGLLADARVFPRANLSWPRRIALATVGFVLIVGLVGPILDTSTFFYLSTAPTPELAAVVYLAGLPVNAIHGAATALTLLVVANPLARPTRPRPREVRFTRSVAPQLPISRAPTACKSRFSRSRFSREPTSLTTFKRLIDHTSKLILFFSGAEKHILFDCTRTLSRVLYVSALGTAKHNILWFRW